MGDRYNIRRTLAPPTGGSRHRPPRHPPTKPCGGSDRHGSAGITAGTHRAAGRPAQAPSSPERLELAQPAALWASDERERERERGVAPLATAAGLPTQQWRLRSQQERGAPCLKSMPRYELTTSWSRSLRGAAKGGAVGCAERSARVGCQAQCRPPESCPDFIFKMLEDQGPCGIQTSQFGKHGRLSRRARVCRPGRGLPDQLARSPHPPAGEGSSGVGRGRAAGRR